MRINRNATYAFDTYLDDIPVFTSKNIQLMEAIVNNDSQYRQSFDTKNKHSSAGFLAKYGFPTSYDAILTAVIRIDNENSTHLSVSGKTKGSNSGREIAADYIFQNRDRICSSIASGNVEIVQELSEKLIPSRYTISFASKFCTFTNRYCFGNDHFSIVDTVLCNVLPAYEAIYLSRNTDRNKWIRDKEKKVFDYRSYQNTIHDILTEIQKECPKVGRKEFDLFLWYYYKGGADRVEHLYDVIKTCRKP